MKVNCRITVHSIYPKRVREKQRISIARCTLKDAPIIILDEAAASVDADNESYIQEAISELVKRKTLLVIADRRISEQGTYDELTGFIGKVLCRVRFEKLSLERWKFFCVFS